MDIAKKSNISIRIKIICGDLTRESCDAIVNAANHSLMGGGGVDGAIHRAAGSGLLEECRKIRNTLYPNGLPTGEAVLTGGYDLPARFVIHTVGPVWRGGRSGEAQFLAACYRNVLRIAAKHKFTSIAIPAISTGAYGYPLEPAADIALDVIHRHLAENGYPRIVRLVVIGDNFAIYQKRLARLISQFS